jgi:hypothetical protein
MNDSPKHQLESEIKRFFSLEIYQKHEYKSIKVIDYPDRTLTVKVCNALREDQYKIFSNQIRTSKLIISCRDYEVSIKLDEERMKYYYVNIDLYNASNSYRDIMKVLETISELLIDSCQNISHFKPMKYLYEGYETRVSLRDAKHLIVDGNFIKIKDEIGKFNYEIIEIYERFDNMGEFKQFLPNLKALNQYIILKVRLDWFPYNPKRDVFYDYPNIGEIEIKCHRTGRTFFTYNRTKENWILVVKMLEKSQQEHLFACRDIANIITSFL